MKFKIKAIKEDFLEKVRTRGIDDLNQKVVYVTAKGGEPCRDVLRRAKAGEPLILASYSPFNQSSPYKEYGPVFVLANKSNENVNYSELPIIGNSHYDYLPKSFVFRVYNNKEEIIDAKVVVKEESLRDLSQFFENVNTDFVLARFTAYGCYGLRVERDVT